MAKKVEQLYYLAVRDGNTLTPIAKAKDSLAARALATKEDFLAEHKEILGKETCVVILRDEPAIVPELIEKVCPHCGRPFEGEKTFEAREVTMTDDIEPIEETAEVLETPQPPPQEQAAQPELPDPVATPEPVPEPVPTPEAVPQNGTAPPPPPPPPEPDNLSPQHPAFPE